MGSGVGGFTLWDAGVTLAATPTVTTHRIVHMIRPPNSSGSTGFWAKQLDLVANWADLRAERCNEILSQLSPPLVFWASVLGLDPQRHKWTLEVVAAALRLANHAEMRFKHALACRRPVEMSPQLQPMIQTPGHGSLPSGHATEAHICRLRVVEAAACGRCGQAAGLLRAADATGGACGHQPHHRRRALPGRQRGRPGAGAGVGRIPRAPCHWPRPATARGSSPAPPITASWTSIGASNGNRTAMRGGRAGRLLQVDLRQRNQRQGRLPWPAMDRRCEGMEMKPSPRGAKPMADSRSSPDPGNGPAAIRTSSGWTPPACPLRHAGRMAAAAGAADVTSRPRHSRNACCSCRARASRAGLGQPMQAGAVLRQRPKRLRGETHFVRC